MLGIKDGKFVWVCPFEKRDLPKKAGFKFNQESGWWETTDWYKAYQAKDLTQTVGSFNQKIIELEDTYQKSYKKEPEGLIFKKNSPIIKNVEQALATLDPYQVAGVEEILKKKVTLLADEPGLGKTAQVLVANHLSSVARTLIVCPATLKDNWHCEILKWIAPPTGETHRISIVWSTNAIIDFSAKYLIVNYDILAYKSIREQLMRYEYGELILDESHYLKNYNAQRTKEVLHLEAGLISRSKKITFISGTPILNRPVEIYPILRTAAPQAIDHMDFMTFTRKFCAGHETPFGYNCLGASNVEELNFRLRSTIMVRRSKKDVKAQLSEFEERVIPLKCSPDAIKFLKEHEGTLENQIKALRGEKHEKVPVETMSEIRRGLCRRKLTHIYPMLEELLKTREKIIVFAYHRDVIELIEQEMKKYNPVVITGETPSEKRQELVEKFQSDPSCKVFIGNIKAAGVGITLTASFTVCFVETTWTPGEMQQAIDRANRFGQTERVEVYYFPVKDTVEVYLIEEVIKKGKVLSKLLK